MPKMSSTSNFLFLFLITIFLLSQVSSFEDAIEAQAHQPQSTKVVKGPNRRLSFVDCDGLCAVRCGKHSRPNVCTRACGTCCQRCNCVPPGTHGNREICGSCYTDMLTHGNRPKCP